MSIDADKSGGVYFKFIVVVGLPYGIETVFPKPVVDREE
jgi:hypothetical protein